MVIIRMLIVVFSALIFAGTWGTANAQQSVESQDTNVIKVTSPRLERELYETPAAVSVTNAPDIREGQQRLQLDESLDTVPGLFFQNRYNFAQNLRLSTRGFGARAPFGIRGIRIQVDGIPYTLPDGQSQIDAVDLDSAQRIEVIRGPSSVQYGNASGGDRHYHGPRRRNAAGRAPASGCGKQRLLQNHVPGQRKRGGYEWHRNCVLAQLQRLPRPERG